jgi:hypothetical protein
MNLTCKPGNGSTKLRGCYPVGVNPTYPKLSQQDNNEPHVQARQREYEAEGIEDAGCDIEPRNMYSCGH